MYAWPKLPNGPEGHGGYEQSRMQLGLVVITEIVYRWMEVEDLQAQLLAKKLLLVGYLDFSRRHHRVMLVFSHRMLSQLVVHIQTRCGFPLLAACLKLFLVFMDLGSSTSEGDKSNLVKQKLRAQSVLPVIFPDILTPILGKT